MRQAFAHEYYSFIYKKCYNRFISLIKQKLFPEVNARLNGKIPMRIIS
ncbi:hypothetical protein FRA_22c00100 [Francisella sp. W12-1067]|nr:hypothetical protein FRA_22c00100 [Francisella sp. W12-1067]